MALLTSGEKVREKRCPMLMIGFVDDVGCNL